MHILVAIDGSRHADRALSWALREAHLRGAHVRVITAFRVHEFAGPFNRPVSVEDERARAQQMVDDALDRAGGPDHADVEVTASAVTGRGAADAILRHRGEADLIVVGSRGLGGFPGLLLGSVSHQVAAHADVPVAVIPADGEQITDEADGTRTIVVGVDGSTPSVEAVRWAVAEGRVRSVPVTALYVYRSLREGAPFDGFATIDDTELADLERHATKTALNKLDTLLRDAGDEVADAELDRRVVSGSPARVLIAEAAEASSLLVVGSRGRGGFRGLLLGSVSQQCLHHARGPVVVTPAHD